MAGGLFEVELEEMGRKPPSSRSPGATSTSQQSRLARHRRLVRDRASRRRSLRGRRWHKRRVPMLRDSTVHGPIARRPGSSPRRSGLRRCSPCALGRRRTPVSQPARTRLPGVPAIGIPATPVGTLPRRHLPTAVRLSARRAAGRVRPAACRVRTSRGGWMRPRTAFGTAATAADTPRSLGRPGLRRPVHDGTGYPQYGGAPAWRCSSVRRRSGLWRCSSVRRRPTFGGQRPAGRWFRRGRQIVLVGV